MAGLALRGRVAGTVPECRQVTVPEVSLVTVLTESVAQLHTPPATASFHDPSPGARSCCVTNYPPPVSLSWLWS